MHLRRSRLFAIMGSLAFLVIAVLAVWWYETVHATTPVDLHTLTTAQWRADLRYMARQLAARHADAFHRVGRTRYWELVAQIDSAIASLPPSATPVYFQKLTAAIGDAHTYLALPSDQHFYPFDIYYFGDTPVVVRASSAYQDLLGASLVKIDSLDMPAVEARLDEILTQGENAWYYRAHYPWFLSREVLFALGVVSDTRPATMTFTRVDGTTTTRTIAASDTSPPQWVHAYAHPPLFIAHADDDFWFTTLPHTTAVYVAFNSYRHLASHAGRRFDTLDQDHATALIIDLRENGGGDYLVGHRELIAPIRRRTAINRAGHLFVITGRYTFSAAMNNAAQFRTETHAILVGEPAGEVPNSYQERRSFRLPHSHLVVNYSMRYYRFLPQDVPALLPDHGVDPDWASYRAGRDPALEWILSRLSE